jgi:altronate dehydratase
LRKEKDFAKKIAENIKELDNKKTYVLVLGLTAEQTETKKPWIPSMHDMKKVFDEIQDAGLTQIIAIVPLHHKIQELPKAKCKECLLDALKDQK